MLKLNCKPPLTLKRITNNKLTKYRLYATEINPAQPIKPVKKKGIFRKLILPTTLLGGTLYGAGIYGSSQNDKFRDFFMDQVPLGEKLLNFFEESNLEHVADLSKGTMEVLDQSIKKIKTVTGITTSEEKTRQKDSPTLEKIKAKTEAAVQRGKDLSQDISNSLPSPPKNLNPNLTTKHSGPSTTTTATKVPISDQAPISLPQPSAQTGMPTYNREIPIGHEPPPGYRGSAPRPRDPSTEPLPPPPALPLLAPTVKNLSSSEPILGQLASSIDSLAGFLRDHPDVVVRGKDPSGKDAPRVLSTASEELKNLAGRLETIKSEKQAQLQNQLESQAKEYGKILLDAERELHQRLDQQEESWKNTFDQERSKLAKSFEDKLAKELETQQALINERLEQEVISQGLEMQRRWMREIKSQVELEREGRWGKLAELEGCMKQLGRVTLDNEEYLEDHLRINQLWNAIRAISASAFENHSKVPLDHEARALQRISDRAKKANAALAEEGSGGGASSCDDVISVALESMPAVAIDAGVESLPGLTLWFKNSVSPRIQSASLLPTQGGLISYFTSHILSNFFFTNVAPQTATTTSSLDHQPQDPISILNQVNALLDVKDLEQATRLLNSLNGWPKVLARDWLQAARRHLELHQAIQVIEAEATLQSLLL
ncbi:Formation of crista junctions protein 1 [Puccinia graminis f. sp. tritici]|uniref:MICOS complex subunit MIC60 n=1 Tax=Puccinia graminis f. sp. tritici TaxID=56615 RepID=A0A5B0NBN9_PUCGR|nr:Formation of crista junctions protein 1 [Puccinia graminis f. sp. tritici]